MSDFSISNRVHATSIQMAFKLSAQEQALLSSLDPINISWPTLAHLNASPVPCPPVPPIIAFFSFKST